MIRGETMKRVLFVDVRNATRSQIAEAWFNHLAGGWAQARSCGTLPAEKIGGRATVVMQELGVDIRYQFPKAISQRMLDQADMLVIMGSGIYPRTSKPTRFWNLEDPTGKPLETVRQLRDQICLNVDKLITQIYEEESELEFTWTNIALPQPVWN
jgi:arsenate reductase (thioredoxin)